MCVKERDYSVDDLEQYLSSMPREEACTIINAGNRNGKTPFHHACQFRSTPETVELLLRFNADINASTRRGHTALIYACGRGRSQTVYALLAAGANVKVRAVTGDDALSMGEGRLDESAMGALKTAYQESSEPLLDFTASPDALVAQADHVSGCKHCREKQARAATLNVPPTEHELALRQRLSESIAAGLVAPSRSEACAAIAASLVDTAISLDAHDIPVPLPPSDAHSHLAHSHASPDRFRGLVIELGSAFKSHGAEAVTCVLGATREEKLGRQLNQRGVRDRKFPRVILSSVLAGILPLPSLFCLQPVLAGPVAGQAYLRCLTEAPSILVRPCSLLDRLPASAPACFTLCW